MSAFDAWLRGQINRPDHVGNLAFEAGRDEEWPLDTKGPDDTKRYLLEKRGIYGQKIYTAVDSAWAEFERDEVEDWKAPGGWLYELIGPEQLGYPDEDAEDVEVCQ